MHFGVQEKLLVEQPLEINDWRGPLDCLNFHTTQQQNGAPMLKALTSGIQWVRSNTKIVDGQDLVVPEVMFTRGSDSPYVLPSPFCFDPERNHIRVDIDHLLQASSRLTVNEIISTNNPQNDEVSFYGSVGHFCTLNGAHETEHARWEQFEGMPMQRGLHPERVSRVEYDAQPWEFKAKQTELAVAKHFGMSDKTIAILQRDVNEALELIQYRTELEEQYRQRHWTNWRAIQWLRNKISG